MTLFVNYWTLSSFAILIITSPHWVKLPEWYWSISCLVWLLLGVKFRWLRWGYGLAIALFLLTISGFRIHQQIDTLFSAGSDSTINAEVDSLFKPISHGFQGIAIVNAVNGQPIAPLFRPRIYLTAPLPLKLGDRVSAKVRVKPIIGTLNQVGFDQEKYAISQRVVAKATVKVNSSMIVRSSTSLRQRLFEQAKRLTTMLPHQGLLLALSFGERSYLNNIEWQRLQHSGLTHLIAISGLHIGIAFGFGWWIGFYLLRLGRFKVWLPSIFAFSCALGYAWLAGFSITTQRALVLLLILLGLRMLGVHTSYRFKWLLMVAALLFYDPFSVYANSFYLSVLAVALVFFLLSITPTRWSKWQRLLGLQAGLILLMTPIVAFFFNGFGLASLFYNAVFVPWFSFVVVPITLLAVAMTPIISISGVFFSLADFCLVPVSVATQYSQLFWQPLSSAYTVLLTALIVLLLLKRLLNRQVFALLLCMAIFSTHSRREDSLWRVDVLDVGHGLAVIIEKNRHAVVYDTGVKWPKGSFANSLIIPYLHARGLTLDSIIISHFDGDHAGGLADLKARYPDVLVISSQQPSAPSPSMQACIRGEGWQWQGLTFEVLWPPQLVKRAYNPHSCVIRLAAEGQQGSLLLTGDIESIAEWTLVREPDKLDSDVVLVPHHGSKTSSLAEFVSAVDAKLAIASSAYLGRWQLPNPAVRQRYFQQGSIWLETGQAGQISVEFLHSETGDKLRISTLRIAKGEAWYRQMLRKRVE